MWLLEIDLGLLEEKLVILTSEPSFQPDIYTIKKEHFNKYNVNLNITIVVQVVISF